MSNQTATLNVLRTLCLFGHRGGRLGIPDVMHDLGVSRATAYRYLSNLEAFGLASRFGRGDFILGPEVALLEKAARAGDPLLAAAAPVMGSLCKGTGATVLLERASGQRLVVAQVLTGPSGPQRLAEFCGSVDSALRLFNDGTMQGVEGAVARRIWVQNEAGPTPDRGARGGKRVSVGERGLSCLLDGERIDAEVWARNVQLQGIVVARLVALVQPDATSGLVSTGIEEQLRRSALRLEGRLEASL